MTHDACDECGSPGRCRPECSHVAPADAFADFLRGCVSDCVEARPSSMSVVDEDRLTRRNAEWLDAKRFR